mgnify:CR=1 FL=1
MKLLPLLLLLIAGPVSAQQVTPNFTTGSMTQTVQATQTINETIAIERYGGAVATWNGDNVSAVAADGTTGANIVDTNTNFFVVDSSQPWQLEIVTRAAGIVETEDITRTINLTTTTNTLSVFAQ